jgi:hypothetical protein
MTALKNNSSASTFVADATGADCPLPDATVVCGAFTTTFGAGATFISRVIAAIVVLPCAKFGPVDGATGIKLAVLLAVLAVAAVSLLA